MCIHGASGNKQILTQKIKKKILKKYDFKISRSSAVLFQKDKKENNLWFLTIRSKPNRKLAVLAIHYSEKWFIHRFYVYDFEHTDELQRELFDLPINKVFKELKRLCKTDWKDCPKEELNC